MKRLIASTLFATAALSGAAQALTGPALYSEAGYVLPGADFSSLSPSQISAIYTLAQSDGTQDPLRTGNQAERR